MSSLEEKKKRAKTSIVRTVFPGSTNHYDTLFGGNALKWMDEVAFITATRFGRSKFVTVSTDRIDFNTPIPEGHFVELIGEIGKVGKSSVVVEVSVYLEEMYSEYRNLAVKGEFTFVAIGENRRPVALFSEDDKNSFNLN